MKKPVNRKFHTLIGLFLLLITATGLNLNALYSNLTLLKSGGFHPVSTNSAISLDGDFQLDLPSGDESLHHSHWFENNERQEKDEKDLLIAIISDFLGSVIEANLWSIDSSVKSFAQSITNITPIPLYDFQHSWRVHCA